MTNSTFPTWLLGVIGAALIVGLYTSFIVCAHMFDRALTLREAGNPARGALAAALGLTVLVVVGGTIGIVQAVVS